MDTLRRFSTPLRLILCFLALPLCMAAVIRLTGQDMAALGPDARVYLSVADNVLSTGHFIQNVRPAGSSVVPFGLPLILTLFRAVGMSVPMILFVQYILFGGACWLLSQAERDVLGGGFLAPVFFAVALVRAHLDLNDILLEFYFLFCLAAILRILARRDMAPGRRVTLLNVFGFAAFAIRTVLILVYLPILACTLYAAIRGRIGPGRLLPLLLVPALLMGANAAVNHRETGYWILTDNYSGLDIYAANNPGTRAGYYASRFLPEFVTGEYYEIEEDPDLDPTEKDRLYSSLAREWIRENPSLFARNTLKKFRIIFIDFWRNVLVLCFLCGVGYILRLSPHRALSGVCLGINLLLALVTSMGLVMGRYTIPVWPLASLHLAAGCHGAARLLRRLRNRGETPSP